MSDASRQQRRRQMREQTKLGTRALDGGLPPEPQRDVTIAAARVVVSKLGEANNPARARQAAELSHRLCESSLKAYPPRLSIACRQGCAYCCYQFAAATAPEIFLLADLVRTGRVEGRNASEVVARAAPLIDVPPADRLGAKLPCPLLVDERCGAYRQRPLVCRQATSLDVGACLEEFEGRNLEGRVEVSSIHLAHAGSANVILLGAVIAAGLVDESVELAAGLTRALGDPDCERRWLAGERVFGEVSPVLRRSPDVDQVARQIAAELA
jgi:Fe-S-cluster containining protein